MEETNGGESEREDEAEKCLNGFSKRFERKLRDPKFVLECAGFVVLCLYAGFTIAMYFVNRDAANAAKESADAAKSAADTAAKQFETSERPWVDADIRLDGPLSFNVNGANLPLVFQLQNTGHSAALAVQIAVRPQAGFLQSADPSEYRDKVCQEATREVIQVPHFGMSLFPNHSFTQHERILFGNVDITKAISKSRGASPDEFEAPAIVFCIGYRTVRGSAGKRGLDLMAEPVGFIAAGDPPWPTVIHTQGNDLNALNGASLQ